MRFVYPGIEALAEGIIAKSALHLLDISDNEIGPTGAQALATALEQVPTLNVLRLRGNRIGDEGAAALSAALAASGLHELDAGHNQVGALCSCGDLVARHVHSAGWHCTDMDLCLLTCWLCLVCKRDCSMQKGGIWTSAVACDLWGWRFPVSYISLFGRLSP